MSLFIWVVSKSQTQLHTPDLAHDMYFIMIRVKSADHSFRKKEQRKDYFGVFEFPLRFVHTFGISINPRRMETHLFVLWTGETIKMGFFSHLQRKQCSASRSISSDTQSDRTEEKKTV